MSEEYLMSVCKAPRASILQNVPEQVSSVLALEMTKDEDRRKFKALQAAYKLNEQRCNQLHDAIIQSDKLASEIQAPPDAMAREIYAEVKRVRDEVSRLQRLVMEQEKHPSPGRKFLCLLKKTPANRKLKKVETALSVLKAACAKDTEGLKKQLAWRARRKTKAEQKQRRQTDARHSRIPFADSAVIGNRQPDHATVTQQYELQSDAQKIVLLEVARIAGKEAEVIQNIWVAVPKLHAVLYVTGNAAALQTVDRAYNDATGRAGTVLLSQKLLPNTERTLPLGVTDPRWQRRLGSKIRELMQRSISNRRDRPEGGI